MPFIKQSNFKRGSDGSWSDTDTHDHDFEEAELDSKQGETFEKDGYVNNEIFDMVDAIVPRTDDPMQPALTFRVILLGFIFSTALATINTVFTFRSFSFTINSFCVVLIAYPLGNLMYWTISPRIYTLPYFGYQFSLNPGPFSFKEHTLIYIIANTASNPSYALYNIVTQKHFLGHDITLFWSIAFAIVSQLTGYAVAGLFRRFLIRPATMLWPGVLNVVAGLISMHGTPNGSHNKKSRTMKQSTFFWLCVVGMAVYQLFPSMIAPLLGTVSVLCYVTSYNQRLRMFGSATQGVGMLSLSFDWMIIGQMGPIASPLWAVWNQIAGLWFFLWIVIPILWSFNVFGADQLLGSNPLQGPNGSAQFPLGQALNSASLFDKYGNAIDPLSLVTAANNTVVFNQVAYDSLKPIYITTFYAVQIMVYFLTFASAISHAVLWYGRDIYHRFTVAVRDLDSNDIHAQLMDLYQEVSENWYILLLALCTITSFSICTWGKFDLPWWGVLLSTFFTLISIIPLGIIESISGQRVLTNLESELLFGFLMPGHVTSLMTFKTLTYASTTNALTFCEDLKLGHYCKIPPRVMFGVQIGAMVWSAIVNVVTVFVLDSWIGLTGVAGGKFAGLGWNAYKYQLFFSSATVWGVIGSNNFVGPDSPYFILLAGFIIGLVAPLIPYGLHMIFPNSYWNLVNIPIFATFHGVVGSTRSDMITSLLVAVGVNYFWKRYRFATWKKFAFVMSSAFDMGSGVGVMLVMFGAIAIGGGWTMPFWLLNPVDQEGCAPPSYLLCKAREIMNTVIDDGQC
ncbi:OPT superfamily oligopeptide transporter [Rhizoclosmatium globosum]|uniref:OPT superfamily oligopeptide transporter n=1 Tax=Rhizoclosmatium globosum TaxID=329046 RepID=A0A1Y2CG87_9FUNG|nr:OPT superfamily oligopeptide transporter [Rhizoclosmatium globosum]|eukprot:ORY46051.1 OPT superfamily oligopeptide transporter [Rhizoclosmatium globosum]